MSSDHDQPGDNRLERLERDDTDLYEQAPCAYLSTLQDGTIVRGNQTFFAWIGARSEDIVGTTRFQALLTIGSRIYYETHYAPLLQMQGFVNEIALEVRRTDGTVRPIVASARQRRASAGSPTINRVALFDSTDRRRYEQELLQARKRAEDAAQALATADPNNRDYQKSLAETLGWAADAERDAGHIDRAIALRERHLALLNSFLGRTGDVAYRQRLVGAERKLAMLYATRGQNDLAEQHARTAVAQGEQLTLIEPDNSKWLENSAVAKYYLAYILAINRKADEASQQNDTSCSIISRLIAKDPKLADWRYDYRECWIMRGYVDFAKGANPDAAKDAEQALRIARSSKSSDAANDAFATARAYRLLGDARSQLGDKAAATAAWNAAFQALPRVSAEKPNETQEHAIILQRLGRVDEAHQFNQRLAAMGYRLREVTDLKR